MASSDITAAGNLVRDAEDIFWRLRDHSLANELDSARAVKAEMPATYQGIKSLTEKADAIVEALESVFNS